jgi:hypothetical protein
LKATGLRSSPISGRSVPFKTSFEVQNRHRTRTRTRTQTRTRSNSDRDPVRISLHGRIECTAHKSRSKSKCAKPEHWSCQRFFWAGKMR